MKLKKKVILMANVMLCVALFCACGKEGTNQTEIMSYSGVKEDITEKSTEADRVAIPSGYPSMPFGSKEEKGYDLPVSDSKRKEEKNVYQNYTKKQIKAMRPMLSLQMRL